MNTPYTPEEDAAFRELAEMLEDDHPDVLRDTLSHYDEATVILYSQVEDMMQGKGGDTFDAAASSLKDRGAFTLMRLQAVMETSIAQMERLESCDFMAKFIIAEDNRRVAVLQRLTPDGSFSPNGDAEKLAEYLTEKSTEVDSAEELAIVATMVYQDMLNQDLSDLSKHLPPNLAEQRRDRINKLRKAAMSASIDIAKIAAGAGIALMIAGHNRK
jgi:hypothetical protein